MYDTRSLYAALLVVALAGCSNPQAEVQSDTTWTGLFGDKRVDGRGDATVSVTGPKPRCAIVQKQTEGGFLRLRIVPKDPTGPSSGGWVETVVPFGAVSACLDVE